jgi:hypothetical protein
MTEPVTALREFHPLMLAWRHAPLPPRWWAYPGLCHPGR